MEYSHFHPTNSFPAESEDFIFTRMGFIHTSWEGFQVIQGKVVTVLPGAELKISRGYLSRN